MPDEMVVASVSKLAESSELFLEAGGRSSRTGSTYLEAVYQLVHR